METIFFLSAFLFGIAVGSFINVVILRLPDENKSIVFPSSHCPKCSTSLRYYENIPILSYIFLGGKCRACKGEISVQYPLVELAMGLLATALFLHFGFGFELLLYFVFCAALLAIIVIDIYHQIIPDRISLPGIVIGFGGSFLNSTVSWQESALGILLGGGVLYAIAMGYFFVTRRDGMGGGDIKLLAMIGAFLGYQSLLFVIFASSFIGSIIGIAAMLKNRKSRQTRIPFGPFLSGAALLWLFFNEQIFWLWNIYLNRF